MVMGLVLPGFRLFGFVNALVAARDCRLGWAIEAILGERVSPQSRGLIGFIVATIVIYVAQFLVLGMSVTILGALLASLVVGIIVLLCLRYPVAL